MVTACLISTTMNWRLDDDEKNARGGSPVEYYDTMDGPSEEEAYLQGECLFEDLFSVPDE
jgi:hypothetical protein